MLARCQRRSSPAIAQPDDEDGILIDEGILGQQIESRPVAIKFGLKIRCRVIAFALADARFVHPHGREAGSFAKPPENGAESACLAVGYSTLTQLSQPTKKIAGTVAAYLRGESGKGT